MTATFFCTSSGIVSFSLGSQTGTLTCGTATTAGIVATPPSVGVNQLSTISGNCAGSQLITSGAGGQFQSVITGAIYTAPNQLTCTGGQFSASFLCGPSPVTVTFSSGVQTGSLGCGVQVSGGLTLNPPGAGTTTSVSGQCAIAGQTLTVTGPGLFSSATINGVQVPNSAGTASIICSSVGTIIAGFNCSTIGTATFGLAGLTASFSCTSAGAGQCPTGTTFNVATGACTGLQGGGVPSSLSITANPSSLQCTGSSSVAFMSVSVKDAQGQNVQDGTNVTITADSGTFAPSQATTAGGATQFIYSPASTSSGTVNIRASAGNAQGTTQVNVSCSQATAPPAAPPSSPPPPPAGPVVIQPPNTGDAGLASGLMRTEG
jgi:hypothetical protein